jgi:hypothetical protein
VSYIGVPDTSPEVLSEKEIDNYFHKVLEDKEIIGGKTRVSPFEHCQTSCSFLPPQAENPVRMRILSDNPQKIIFTT